MSGLAISVFTLGLLSLYNSVDCCSIIPGTEPPRYTMAETLVRASVVLSGTDVEHQQRNDGRRNYTFEVSCIFKSNGLDIPSTIFLLDVGAISCDGTHMDPVGKSYIIAVKAATSQFVKDWATNDNYFGKDSDVPYYFTMAEPAMMNTAAFDDTKENLDLTSRLCTMDNTIVSRREGASCPQRTGTELTCGQMSGASRSVQAGLMMIFTAVFLV